MIHFMLEDISEAVFIAVFYLSATNCPSGQENSSLCGFVKTRCPASMLFLKFSGHRQGKPGRWGLQAVAFSDSGFHGFELCFAEKGEMGRPFAFCQFAIILQAKLDKKVDQAVWHVNHLLQ